MGSIIGIIFTAVPIAIAAIPIAIVVLVCLAVLAHLGIEWCEDHIETIKAAIAVLVAIEIALVVIKFVVGLIAQILPIIIAAVGVLGGWALIFGFFSLVTDNFGHGNGHEYDDFFRAQDKWNKRHRRW